MAMSKASSTSKEMLILSRESMFSSSKVVSSVMVSAGMFLALAMMSIERLAMSSIVAPPFLYCGSTLQGCLSQCKGTPEIYKVSTCRPGGERLPLKQNELGAEGGPHGGED